MRRLLRALDVRDLTALLGLALLAAGLVLLSLPVALVVVGLVLLAAAAWGAR